MLKFLYWAQNGGHGRLSSLATMADPGVPGVGTPL